MSSEPASAFPPFSAAFFLKSRLHHFDMWYQMSSSRCFHKCRPATILLPNYFGISDEYFFNSNIYTYFIALWPGYSNLPTWVCRYHSQHAYYFSTTFFTFLTKYIRSVLHNGLCLRTKLFKLRRITISSDESITHYRHWTVLQTWRGAVVIAPALGTADPSSIPTWV
jgi:hypothetical protein